MKVVILAGGSGTRLWPVSRKDTPKQNMPILGDKTLLENTYNRLRKSFSEGDIIIAASQKQADVVRGQLPELPADNFIFEPFKKDTAAAIGLAAVKVYKQDPQAILLNVSSDHYIKDEENYLKVLKIVEEIINRHPDAGVLIGINPTHPETGLGYIRFGEEVMDVGDNKIFRIAEFKEKPDLETAKSYLASREYLWNLGCFAWRVDKLLGLYKKFLPDMYAILMNIMQGIGTEKENEILKNEFEKITPISMDYGIVEKATDLFVVPADFGWADIGNWRAVKDILSTVENESVLKGSVVEVDSNNNLVYSYSGRLIALAGIKNHIVIETADAILFCHRDNAQDVKKIVDSLKDRGLEKYL